MIFKKVERVKNFTQMDNPILDNPKLSIAAKGMMAYFIRLHHTWKVHIDEIVRHHKNGRTAITTAVKELMRHGYVCKFQQHGPRGKFSETVYFISEIPEMDENGKPRDFTQKKQVERVQAALKEGKQTVFRFPVDGKTVDGKTVDGKSTAINIDCINTDLKNTEKKEGKSFSQSPAEGGKEKNRQGEEQARQGFFDLARNLAGKMTVPAKGA